MRLALLALLACLSATAVPPASAAQPSAFVAATVGLQQGFSKNLSFDEAFASALESLPATTTKTADAMDRVQVVEIGGLFGGIAGFHDMYVRIRRTSDT